MPGTGSGGAIRACTSTPTGPSASVLARGGAPPRPRWPPASAGPGGRPPGTPRPFLRHRAVAPGRAEPAISAGRAGQRLDLMELWAGHPLDNQLGDPVPALEPYRLRLVGVEQSHLDLATVPGVHGAGRIDGRDAVPGSQAR